MLLVYKTFGHRGYKIPNSPDWAHSGALEKCHDRLLKVSYNGNISLATESNKGCKGA